MRTGGVFSLTWEDIDFENGVINISHSIYDKSKDSLGRWYIGSTKIISGNRQIFISNTLLKALYNFKERQNYLKNLYRKDYKYYHIEDVKNKYGKVIEKSRNNEETINLIFTKDDGSFVGTDLIKYPYSIIHSELGIKKCRFYDLRGTYATKI